jgi:hypothetical protein
MSGGMMQVLNKPSFEEIAMNAEIGAYQEDTGEPPLSPDDFLQWLRSEGPKRYHDLHPFHLRMHEGELTRQELEACPHGLAARGATRRSSRL